jgi:hypothetical protein
VIRNAVIHIANEQPLLADLYSMPSSTDVSLVCTNVRSLDGKKPIFVDHTTSAFVFPYLHVRFIEVPPGAGSGLDASPTDEAPVEQAPPVEIEAAEGDDELDEDFLRRIREV